MDIIRDYLGAYINASNMLELGFADTHQIRNEGIVRKRDQFFSDIWTATDFYDENIEKGSIYFSPCLRMKIPANIKTLNESVISKTKLIWLKFLIEGQYIDFEQAQLLETLTINRYQPSLVYTLGHGFVFLWCLEEFIDGIEAKRLIKCLQYYFQEEIKANRLPLILWEKIDLTELLLMPGSLNVEIDPPKPSIIITQEDLPIPIESFADLKQNISLFEISDISQKDHPDYALEITGADRKKELTRFVEGLIAENWNPKSIEVLARQFDYTRCNPPIQDDNKRVVELIVKNAEKKIIRGQSTEVIKNEYSINAVLDWLDTLDENNYWNFFKTAYKRMNISDKHSALARAISICQNLYIMKTDNPAKIYQYNGIIWEAKTDNWLGTQIHEEVGNLANAKLISNIKYLIYSLPSITIEPNMFNGGDDYNYVNMNDGYLDLSTMKFYKHDASKYFVSYMPVHFEPKAKCPKWIKFVNEIFPDTEEDSMDKRLLLQEWFGYHLVNNTLYQKAMIFLGEARGANGKSVTVNVLQRIIGNSNCLSTSLRDMAKDTFERARFYQKRAAFLSEAAQGEYQNNKNLLNQLISGDPISGREMYAGAFEFKNKARITIATNHRPDIQDVSTAWHRKIMFLCFNENFEDKKDIHLAEKLTTPQELSGILNWSIEGWKRLYKNKNFTEPISGKLVTKSLIKESNPIRAFIESVCIYKANNSLSTEQVYVAFKKWYLKNIGKSFNEDEYSRIKTIKTFTSFITVIKGVKYKRLGQYNGYSNLGWRE